MRKCFLSLAICLLVLSATHAWAERIPDTGHPDDPACNPRSFTALGNGIIRDNVTGLEWLQQTSPTQKTWFAAFTYCEGTFADLSDWRLPTVAELETLVDHNRYNPAITPLFDMNTEAPHYWTADAYQNNPGTGKAWYVDFEYGWVDNEINTYTNSVRPVRGASYGSLNNFIVNGDGTVTDTITGLMWQQCTSDQTWEGAQCRGSVKSAWWDLASEYIESLNGALYLGYDDWRLPTRNELQSLVDYSSYDPATTFPDTEPLSYWSSTNWSDSDLVAWGVGFFDGYGTAYEKEGALLVRAVRGGRCGCRENSDCDDNVACNGEETCEEETCEPGTTTCEVTKYCDESIDACVECLSDDHCSDDVFCNGAEICTDGLCGGGTEPCGGEELCDEDIDQCVECFIDNDCPDDSLFCTGTPHCEESLCGFEDPCTGETPGCDEANDQCVAGFIQIDKASIKAGKSTGADSIKLSGLLNASADDFLAAIGDTIIVSLMADYIPGSGTIEYTFPVEPESLNNGKYTSPKVKTAPVTSLTIDTNKGTMKFSAKNADLSGTSCPITCKVTIGDDIYFAEVEIDEDIVNGPKKPCPLPLVMGLHDSLDAMKVKAKKSTKADSDSISISGTFTIDGIFDMNQPLIITIGSGTFTVPGAEFAVKKSSYRCKSYDTGNGLVTAKFDTVKCTFSISIKKTALSDSDDVNFEIDLFCNKLQASTQISLPTDP